MKKKWVLSLGVVALVVVAALAGARALFHTDGTPQYAWLVFRSEGKLRVQIRLKGEAVSLEQFVDGKSTGRKDHFRNGSECANFTIADPDGKTSYVITSMSNSAAQPGIPTELFVDVDVKGQLEYRQYCDLQELKEDPQKAPVAHFHGPLTAGPVTISWKIPPKLALQRGAKPTDLPAYVGTMNAEKWKKRWKKRCQDPLSAAGPLDAACSPGPGAAPHASPHFLTSSDENALREAHQRWRRSVLQTIIAVMLRHSIPRLPPDRHRHGAASV
jgi:hypothetical protein